MLRAFRIQQGLKKEELIEDQVDMALAQTTQLSDKSSSNSTGEWYFYNQAVKAKGFNDFKSKWGNRPNVDNWEVQSMVNTQITALTPADNLRLNGSEPVGNNGNAAPVGGQLTMQALLEAVPLTPEKMKKSRDSVENALFMLGKSLQDYLPDYICPKGI